jgi:hypothetical protein
MKVDGVEGVEGGDGVHKGGKVLPFGEQSITKSILPEEEDNFLFQQTYGWCTIGPTFLAKFVYFIG